MMKRGDVYWVNLSPSVGSEIRKKRPCVLVGATPINKARRTVIVLPLSTSAKPHSPITVSLTCMGRSVVAVCDQIRAVDKSRLLEIADQLTQNDLNTLDNALKQVLVL